MSGMYRSLIRPVVSDEYEVARKITADLLQKGLISKAEFDKIDAENISTFIGEANHK